MRQIVLDTETTGLDAKAGHRIIEIGCIELINRRLTHNHYHVYLNPERRMDANAIKVHGITQEFLADKASFEQEAENFLDFVQGAELVIHNAPFDIGFINAELQRLNPTCKPIEHYCSVLDTLVLARKKHPGQRNSLDALCKRYRIDNSHRELHGALLDSEILADVYLRMTGGQKSLSFNEDSQKAESIEKISIKSHGNQQTRLTVIVCNEKEEALHQTRLNIIEQKSSQGCLWKNMDERK